MYTNAYINTIVMYRIQMQFGTIVMEFEVLESVQVQKGNIKIVDVLIRFWFSFWFFFCFVLVLCMIYFVVCARVCVCLCVKLGVYINCVTLFCLVWIVYVCLCVILLMCTLFELCVWLMMFDFVFKKIANKLVLWLIEKESQSSVVWHVCACALQKLSFALCIP